MLIYRLLLLLACCIGQAQAFEACGSIRNSFGPFDYWVDRDKLDIVEIHHFTSEVENLRRGITGAIGADIDYTLRAFPNHPRALIAMMKLGEKLKTERPSGTTYSVACYFDRAIRFRPEDGMVRVIYATYLSKHGKSAEAVAQLKLANEKSGNNPNIEYNLGLAFFDLGDYAQSLEHAHRAYQMGFPLPGLRNKLQRVGKWRDAPPGKAEPASPEAAQATRPPAQAEQTAPPVAQGASSGRD